MGPYSRHSSLFDKNIHHFKYYSSHNSPLTKRTNTLGPTADTVHCLTQRPFLIKKRLYHPGRPLKSLMCKDLAISKAFCLTLTLESRFPLARCFSTNASSLFSNSGQYAGVPLRRDFFFLSS